jgi:hypothetical protein
MWEMNTNKYTPYAPVQKQNHYTKQPEQQHQAQQKEISSPEDIQLSHNMCARQK